MIQSLNGLRLSVFLKRVTAFMVKAWQWLGRNIYLCGQNNVTQALLKDARVLKYLNRSS